MQWQGCSKIIISAIVVTLIISGCATVNFKPQVKKTDELLEQNKASFILNTNSPNAQIFLISFKSGINHNAQDLPRLRDTLLKAEPIEKDKQIIVEPGRYVVAIKTKVRKGSDAVYDLGASVPGNILIPSSSTGISKAKLGYGIIEGALFKSADEVGKKYEVNVLGFSSGEPETDWPVFSRYCYLFSQDTKEIMLRWLEGESMVEVWLLSDIYIEPGVQRQQNLKMLP